MIVNQEQDQVKRKATGNGKGKKAKTKAKPPSPKRRGRPRKTMVALEPASADPSALEIAGPLFQDGCASSSFGPAPQPAPEIGRDRGKAGAAAGHRAPGGCVSWQGPAAQVVSGDGG